jgi:hypothetical protein
VDVRRNLIFTLVGAVLGSALTVILQAFQANSPNSVVLGSSLVMLFGASLLTMRVLGPLHLILGSAGNVNLEGDWVGSFEYEKNDKLVRVFEVVRIRQTGRLVKGTSRSTAIDGDFPFDSTTYDFGGALRADGIIDGTWHNTVVNHRYHGALQAKVRRDGTLICGTWIGVDDHGINRGTFEWSRGGRQSVG